MMVTALCMMCRWVGAPLALSNAPKNGDPVENTTKRVSPATHESTQTSSFFFLTHRSSCFGISFSQNPSMSSLSSLSITASASAPMPYVSAVCSDASQFLLTCLLPIEPLFRGGPAATCQNARC